MVKIAKVSPTTVSTALNDSPYINKQTQARMKLLAKELNDVPNDSAMSLVLQKPYNIAVFCLNGMAVGAIKAIMEAGLKI